MKSLIFVDDYFNCLTVGTVMRPVTDKHKITRAKLAYIIDATAAPICIIAPISSWAAAVGSSLPEDSGVDGFSLFLHTIPFNLYALLTICFMLFLVAGDFDFAAMKRYEEQVKKTGKETTVEAEAMEISGKGKVIDLILPILVLIAFCVSGIWRYGTDRFLGSGVPGDSDQAAADAPELRRGRDGYKHQLWTDGYPL